MKKLFLLLLIVLFACGGCSGNKGADMEFEVKTVLNYRVLQNTCFVSNVAVAKLEQSALNVTEYIGYGAKNCTVSSAVFDGEKNKITVTFSDGKAKTESVEILVEAVDFAHSVITAEATLKSLDSKAIAAKPKGTVMIGDSLFANWVNPQTDMAFTTPLYNFGVGGFCVSDLADIIFYRFVLPLDPSAIIMHVGVNDIFQAGIAAENYISSIEKFIETVKSYLPQCKIYFVSIVRPTDIAPTVGGIIGEGANARRAGIDSANFAMKTYCETTGNAIYIDGEAAYCNENGRSKTDCFYGDGIHILPDVYPAWGSEIAKAING